MPPLLPFPPHCRVGVFLRRRKRFSVEIATASGPLWVHSNNSGAMLGLARPGLPVLVSPAANPRRKLPYTLEAVGLPFWVGVNTLTPNRLLEAAFRAGRLPFARPYARLVREAPCGPSRFDALLTGPGLPELWVEAKNVTLVEDDVACFPDAATERGCKHLRQMRDMAEAGRAVATFYLVQRPDGHCFAPAEVVDPDYAALFRQARRAGVRIFPFRATVTEAGVDLADPLPLAPGW